MELRQRLTIYRGTRKYRATAVRTGRHDDPQGTLIAFKPWRAPGWCYYEDRSATTVILDGWDHPEFDDLIRAFQSAGATQICLLNLLDANGRKRKGRYEDEYEAYLKSIAPERILLDTRKVASTCPREGLPS